MLRLVSASLSSQNEGEALKYAEMAEMKVGGPVAQQWLVDDLKPFIASLQVQNSMHSGVV